MLGSASRRSQKYSILHHCLLKHITLSAWSSRDPHLRALLRYPPERGSGTCGTCDNTIKNPTAHHGHFTDFFTWRLGPVARSVTTITGMSKRRRDQKTRCKRREISKIHKAGVVNFKISRSEIITTKESKPEQNDGNQSHQRLQRQVPPRLLTPET